MKERKTAFFLQTGYLADEKAYKAGNIVIPGSKNPNHIRDNFAMFDFTLSDEEMAQKGASGYEYELGSLAYWDEGSSVALIYKASREETVVPVVPIGKITSDVSVFEEYGESITIEMVEDSIRAAEGGETVFTADTKVWDGKNG